MNNVAEMINVVTDYIRRSKGVHVTIKPPKDSVELRKLTDAYNIALRNMK